jgi:CRP-like cAMP-binding protein
MISETLLEKYGARTKELARNEILFNEGNRALYYWQVASGSIRMFNYTEDGQEFTQGFFGPGESFGEPPLFADFDYPSSAMAVEDTVLFRLSREELFHLLRENFEVHLEITAALSKRLQYKAMILREMSSYPPEHRILTLIDYLKEESSRKPVNGLFEVNLTRQQIADMTGLRVETVIRTIKTLEEKGDVSIINRKVYRKN